MVGYVDLMISDMAVMACVVDVMVCDIDVMVCVQSDGL